MYIYRGKLNFLPNDSQNATNEAITIMFPSEFGLGDPVYTCWQWSTSENSTNMPCWLTGTIDSVANYDIDGNKIGFYGGSNYLGNYRFDGFFSRSKDIEELSIVVRFGNVIGTATNTKLVFKPDSGSVNPGVIVPRIYLGRLANWAPYTIDQTLLVVIPGRIVGEGNAICAFWQWTVDSTGTRKSNVNFTPSIMTNVSNVAGSVSFRFTTTGYYTFHATMNVKETAEPQHLTLAMTNPSNESTGSLTLQLQDLRPPPSGHQPRRIDDNSTTVVVSDTNKIAGRPPNEGSSSLTRSLVEMGSKMVELTNMRLELSEKLNVLLEEAVRDRDGKIAQLESKLRAAEDQNELLNKKLLETKAARERDRLAAQETRDQRGSESELSDDVDDLNELASRDAKLDDFNNQPPLHDDKVDDFHYNQPT